MCGRSSYPQVSSYTPPWINSETYTPFISAVFLSLLEYWFASIEHSPPMHNAWVTITLGDGVTLATGSQFLVEVSWIFAVSLYIYTAHYITLTFTEELTHRQEKWMNLWKLSLIQTNQSLYEGQVLQHDSSPQIFEHTLWPQTTFLIASALMCSVPYDRWCFFPKCHIRFLSHASEYKLEAKVWLHETSW